MTDNTSDAYPWVRQETESHPAYEAFRAYMTLRSFSRVAAHLGKSTTMISKWSANNNWVARVQAYDRHLAIAQTDGQTEWVLEARTETQRLADKLRAHLSEQLDTFIQRKQDPTVRWSQAAGVLIKMQEHACAPIENQKIQDQVDRVAKMLEKVTGEAVS